MNLKELADYLGVSSTSSLRVQIRLGILRAEKVGPRMYLVSDEEAARYKAEHRAGKGKPGRPPKSDAT